MQALHYLTEVGDTHRRSKRYHLALKTYYAIQKVQASLSDTLTQRWNVACSCSKVSAKSNTTSTCTRFVGACLVLTLRAFTSRDTSYQQLMSLLQNAWLGRHSPRPSCIYPCCGVERSSNGSFLLKYPTLTVFATRYGFCSTTIPR
jgi:hypothetical protein